MKITSSSARLYRCSILIPLLIVLVNQVAAFANAASCRKSCGKLNHIPYPFRLQGDPPHCGEAGYELICENSVDTATVYYDGHKYLVTDISNDYFYYKGIITAHVNCSFTVTTSTCRRLQHDLSFDHFTSNLWASFMNCSQTIKNGTYMEVPSLSVGNTSHVYVTISDRANEIFYLGKFCKFLDTFPFRYDEGIVNSGTQVVEILQRGMTLLWSRGEIGKENCWTYALRLAKFDTEGAPFMFEMLYPIRVYYRFFSCLGVKACKDNQICRFTILKTLVYSQFVFVYSVALALLCRFVLAPFSVFAFLLYNHQKNNKPLDNIEKFLQMQQVLSPRRHTYADIIVMTKHFKEVLGKGGFGQVYKGELLGNQLVAVKMLNSSKFNGEEFINEVSTIGRIHHVNIVQLLGFCSDGTKRALVYDYMPNGSLDKYIFSVDNGDRCSLSSDELNNIALGVARGISYLHSGCDMQILHFDIKPHNILLDSNFTLKISDFGLAKLYPKEQSLISISAARGTIGYIAPEQISRSFGIISDKSDVYSFGMLILEMAGRRRNVDVRMQSPSQIYYPSWIYNQLTQLEAPNFEEIGEIGELEKKLCKVGLWCIQVNPSNRPTMDEVVKFLEGDEDNVPMPPKPFFTDSTYTTDLHSDLSSFSLNYQ